MHKILKKEIILKVSYYQLIQLQVPVLRMIFFSLISKMICHLLQHTAYKLKNVYWNWVYMYSSESNIIINDWSGLEHNLSNCKREANFIKLAFELF